MRFHKNVPMEHREILTEQLKKYKKEIAMTSEERKELHKWVASGRSPYDNGDYIYGENGWPMDFVIRTFCLGKKNWMFHNNANGAHSSALVYSISETAKLNNLRPYYYFRYTLTELPKHCDKKEI